jgi:quercetin dioxygenase-like cupin family protein
MTFLLPETDDDPDPRYSRRGGVYTPADQAIVKWFSGDEYRIRLTAANSGGVLGLVEAMVPPLSGPVAHTHADQDETFYMIDGELEFLDGDQTFMAAPGDVVFIPRTIRHRFKNVGSRPARMLFMYTPGGTEQVFIEGGDEPVSGAEVQPWGPERINDEFIGLLRKYGCEALPEEADVVQDQVQD